MTSDTIRAAPQAWLALRRRSDENRRAVLDSAIASPDFWNDTRRAQAVMRERQQLIDRTAAIDTLARDYADAVELERLSVEGAADALARAEAALRRLYIETLLSGEADANDAYVETRAGAGGEDSEEWSEMLARMYRRFAERHGWRVEHPDEHTMRVRGENAYGWLRTESGVHRLVRVHNGKRHTSFAGVGVYPVVDETVNIEIDPSDVRTDTFRSSGAGGQHVNTTDSAVRLTHIPTGIVVQCQNDRSQHRNRAEAWNMLRSKLYERELELRAAATSTAPKTEIGWGRQIRSYVLHPYRLVKDARTGVERTDPDNVLDGDLDGFMESALAQ